MARITLTRTEFEGLSENYDDVRARYGGRGMYGKTCLGYVGSDPHLFIFDLAKLLVERESTLEATVEDVRDLMEGLGLGSTDSMGYSTIYYWRAIEVEPGVGDDEDDEYEDDEE